MTGRARRVAAAFAILCLSGFAVYSSYVVLDHTDYYTGRTFRALSLENYQLALSGTAQFPYQWRMLGPWAVWLGSRVTGADPHAVDVVLKVAALAISAWALALFAASVLPPSGAVAAVGFYLLLSAAAYASQGYSIYHTSDYLMIAGWFWAVYFASRGRWGWVALVTFASAWAKETLLLSPLLMALHWRRGKVGLGPFALVAAAFAIPTVTLRVLYKVPVEQWAWWHMIVVNVPFLKWDRTAITLALRHNAKVLLFYNVGWWLSIRGALRIRDGFVRDLTLTLGLYLALAYIVVYIRELRHFLPLAIALIPLALREYLEPWSSR